ncbi:MAG: tetratricopeptide repeat protein [Candidatus Mariimomonas ferrooxydans]
MPKAIKKKVTKKVGLKEDEVKSVAARSLVIIKEKKNIFVFSLSALCIVVISIIFFMLYFSSVKEKAYSFEREAYNYYYNVNLKAPLADRERWMKSLELFQKSIAVKSTPTAEFYSGNCYFNLGDYENAIGVYSKFIDKYKKEGLILPLVYQKLASAYIKKANYDEAVKTLNALAQFKNGIFKDSALIFEARLYEAAGKHEDSMTKYREIVNDFPFSIWTAEATAKIGVEEKNGPGISEEENTAPVEPEELTTEGISGDGTE